MANIQNSDPLEFVLTQHIHSGPALLLYAYKRKKVKIKHKYLP